MGEYDFREIEKKWQKRWKDEKAFEANPSKAQKIFVNFPYPYINGYLHLGHAFSVTRVDVYARYKRMQGFNVLFPQGWHCTGTPVWAAAQRVRENEKKQIEIIKSLGFSDSEVSKFGDVKHWIDTFVPAAQEDLSRLGASVDWRRSFITTSLNPRYDSFIRWQFNKLRELGYIAKGKKPVVWCTKDDMPVGDHDRAEGEGETPQEFSLLKFKFGEYFIVAATLRPETVYGQTNLWVNPEAKYVKININNEKWIVSERCVEKLSLQDYKVSIIGLIDANELIGKKVVAPGINREIIILPARFVDPSLGTGIVTSVPSDAPYDYIALRDIKNNKDYNLTNELLKEIKSIEVIPIISTEKYGDKAAVSIVEKYKILNQDDSRLDELTQEVYKEGFHLGVMLNNCGKYSGMRVIEAKEKIKEELRKQGLLSPFYELSSKVVCRCLTPCVVKIVDDQWFLTYSNPDWKQKVQKALEGMKLYPEIVRTQFKYVIGWLNDWACTHHHGTGTKLPWDDKWVIESLSDSTLYMAFYTIAHLLKDMETKDVNDELFDYVFLGKGKGNSKLEPLRKEFEYWYPFDIRSSGKDLVQNHLSFSLFNHVAIFPEKYWPKGFSVNGWLLVNGEKMSKSKGNFFTIRQILEKYPSDAARASLMVGGEGLDDPNFSFENTASISEKLEQFYNFVKENYKVSEEHELTLSDKIFVSGMNKYIKEGSEAMYLLLFRSAFDKLFFQNQRIFRNYTRRGKINQSVVNEYIENQIRVLSPFCPHISEELWEYIGKKKMVALSDWPNADSSMINEEYEKMEKSVENTLSDMSNLTKLMKEKQDKEVGKIYLYVIPNEIVIYDSNNLSERSGKEVKVFAVNDPKKYDPQNKAAKAKPGRPGIYLE